MRRWACALVAALALVGLPAARATEIQLYPNHVLRAGGIHFHTAYSDGAPHTRPVDAYRAGLAAGMSFMAVTEHSEWLALPVEADEDCLNPTVRPATDCLITDPDGLRKWDAQQEQAATVTAEDPSGAYLALRGFEWSSPVQGHVVTLLSTNHENAYLDGGPATMEGYYRWLRREASLGGGADALGIFAHPGREAGKFEEFRYVADVDPQMTGVEVFNRGKDREYFVGGLAQALDRGWHVGAIGSADDHGPSWGRSDRARTVLVVPAGAPWNATTVRGTLAARRFYATHKSTLQLRFRAGALEMGSTVAGAPGSAVTLRVDAYDPAPGTSPITFVDLYTNGPTLVGSVAGPFTGNLAEVERTVSIPPSGETWYVAKVRTADSRNAFSSPIWLRAAP